MDDQTPEGDPTMTWAMDEIRAKLGLEPGADEWGMGIEQQARAALSTADINDLPDSAFAYIEPGGEKDAGGKTTPRSLRHYPVHDKAHADNALARANAAVGGDNADAKAIAQKALPKIKAAVAKFGSDEKNSADVELEHRKALADGLSRRRMSERRASTGPIEVRDSDDGKLHVGGYASVFDQPYDMGFYSETVKRGAFKKTLNEGAQVHLLLNHSGLPLASTMNDTLTLKEDGIGLRYDATLDPEDPDSASAVRKIRSGLLQQSSFAFQPIRQAWSDDYTQRSLTELSIDRGDVSVVNFGASPTTSVEARGALENFERRAVGFALELVESEERAGAKFSAGNLATLKSVLSLVARADTAVDQAQVSLSKLIGVTNPDIAQDAKLDREDYGSSAEQKAAEVESETREPDVAGEPEVEAEPDEPAAEERAATVTHLPLPDYTQSARAMLARARRA